MKNSGLQFPSCSLTEIISKIKMKDTLNSELRIHKSQRSNTDVSKQDSAGLLYVEPLISCFYCKLYFGIKTYSIHGYQIEVLR